MLTTDVVLAAEIFRLVELTGDAAGVDETRAVYGAAGFTGAELGDLLFGTPVRTVAALQAVCNPIDAGSALKLRGALVVTVDGYLGVTLGAGRVVEPAGRQWAMVTPTADRFVWAGLSRSVRYTMWRPA